MILQIWRQLILCTALPIKRQIYLSKPGALSMLYLFYYVCRYTKDRLNNDVCNTYNHDVSFFLNKNTWFSSEVHTARTAAILQQYFLRNWVWENIAALFCDISIAKYWLICCKPLPMVSIKNISDPVTAPAFAGKKDYHSLSYNFGK